MADDLLQRGSRMIERVRTDALSHDVLYVRISGGQAITMPATVDTINTDLLAEDQISIADRMRDFLLAKSDLIQESDSFTPAPGDLIRETIDGVQVAYELVALDAEPCWSFDDQLNLRIRVHTRRVT